jgi:hypothetical protein
MTRGKWRLPLGVVLGVALSELLYGRTPSATFPRGDIVASLSSLGLVIPDWVWNAFDYVFITATPVGPAVAGGAMLCIVVAGADSVKQAVRLGIIVACLDVAIPLAVMIFVAFRGLSFPLSTWAVKAFIQPIAAVVVGAFAGVIIGNIQRFIRATRRRATSSL